MPQTPAPRIEEPGLRADTEPWLAELNQEQRQAAGFGRKDSQGRFESDPLLVIAGAGTGKTATIAHRVAHLVIQGVDPQRILLMSFSRRAALEMTRRAQRLVMQALGESGQARQGIPDAGLRLPWAGTFHSIAARLLRAHAAQIGLPPDFSVLDRSDAADLIDLIRHQQGHSARKSRFPRKDTCLAIYSRVVNSAGALDKVLPQAFPWCAQFESELRTLFREYVGRKQASAVLDYDDLMLWWNEAVSDPALASRISARFDHILVDEYQDTNALQARILHAIRPDGRGLLVVGDDAQSIYGFRAADVGNILEFPQRFAPPAGRITLECNYRSVQPVLDLANALIGEGARQYPKHLRAARAGGQLPLLVSVLDDRAQADWIIGQVLARREQAVPLRKQAVLFRSAHHSDLLEVELTRHNIPYVKHGGLRFLDAAHVKDLVAVLRWAENPRDAISAFRVLQLHAGVGPAGAQRVLQALGRAAQADPDTPAFTHLARLEPSSAAREEWPAFCALMLRIANPAARWEGQLALVRDWYIPVLERRHDDAAVRAADLDMLAQIAQRFGTRERFLTELALDPPQATGDLAGEPLRDEDYLVLSTVHSAKGQEWDSVYVLNVADGNFPNEYATGNPAAVDEERRLLYVAITRARDTLHLVEPLRYYVTQQARLGAGYVHGARSRFLTPAVLARLQQVSAPEPGPSASTQHASRTAGLEGLAAPADARQAAPDRQDGEPERESPSGIAERLRTMW
jgi:DNA helicase-2/ATP-dependent DNA helicase PcrA